MRTWLRGVVVAVLVMTACGDDDGSKSPGPSDAGADVTTDAGPEDTSDTGVDVDPDSPDVPPDDVSDGDGGEPATPQIRMDFGRSGGLFDAPVPSEDLRTDEGIVLPNYPGLGPVDLVNDLHTIVERDAQGFGRSSGVFFTTTVPIDADTLPATPTTLSPDSAMQLVSVDPDSPDYGQRYPITTFFEEDGGPFGAANMLSMLPVQGFVMRTNTLYAAVVLDGVKPAGGASLVPSAAIDALAAGESPAGLSSQAGERYLDAWGALPEVGIDTTQVVALAVFQTGDPLAPMFEARDDILALDRPQLERPLTLIETYDDFCVYSSTVNMPIYQDGDPPFMTAGGEWVYDDDGHLVQQGTEQANVFVTLPRRAAPPGGFPTVVFIRTGGGGDRPLIDRGFRDTPGGEPVEAGSGPAKGFARAGWAGVSVDGPHGGLRNVTNGDEQVLVFNFLNAPALLDNIRQSALEIVLVSHMLDDFTIDASDCPDLAASTTLDTDQIALMGHSTGATIAPLAIGVEPRFKALILSGAGGSWIENVVHKLRPLEIRPLAELLLGYTDRSLHTHDPVLSLLQWAGEPADSQNFATLLLTDEFGRRPPHILMLQGVTDTYILPPIANAASLAFGLDLAGESLDATHPGSQGFVTLEDRLALRDREPLDLPVSGNLTIGEDTTTGIVVQHLQGTVEDGHEVVFQTEPPKHQYRCFLETFTDGGVPNVVVAIDEDAPCP